MSNISLEKTKKQKTDSREIRIVPLFYAYCNHKFGSDAWDKFMKNQRFKDLMTIYEPKYGDSVFKELADIVSEYQNMRIRNLLKDFSEFIHTYY